MFSKLNSLVSLVLPESVKKIAIFGIYECDNIGSLNLPQQCTELAMNAIYGCKNLNTLVIGEKLKVFDGDAINNCNKLEEYKVVSANDYFKAINGILYSKDGTVLVKYPCGLSQETFMIPSSVLKIEDSACEQSLFSEVIFPNSVKTIGLSAFSHCKNLLNLELPNNVTKIGRFAFWECISLNNVLLSDNITEIPDYSFRGCSSLRELSIGKSVSAISDDAFTDCQMLQKFAVEEDNNWYCDFGGILYTKNMDRLVACPTAYYSTNLEIPEGVLAISDHAFYHCSNIEKITLPETLKEIGNAVFSNCVNLESIVMPKQMNAIGYLAFSSCVNLKTLIISDGIEEIGMNFADDCKKLTYLSLPKTINKISSYAFARCSSLKNISCSIVDVNTLIVETSVLNGTYSSFNSIPDDCTWHVPYGCAEKYKSQPWWISTWKIFDDMNTGIETPTQNNDLRISIANGSLMIESGINTIVNIFDIKGSLIKHLDIFSGKTETVDIPAGIYIINGMKFILK